MDSLTAKPGISHVLLGRMKLARRERPAMNKQGHQSLMFCTTTSASGSGCAGLDRDMPTLQWHGHLH